MENRIKELELKIEKINSVIEVIVAHIGILEEKNKRFKDRFKIFKKQNINDELKKTIQELKKEKFTLNDD